MPSATGYTYTGSCYTGETSLSTRPTTSRSYATRPKTGRTTATSYPAQEIICAVSESRGISPIVGLAFVNITACEAVLCQICDSQTYARTVQKLAVFDPTEVLFMRTAADPKSKLYSIVEENLPQLMIAPVDRRYWAEATGHEYVEQLAFSEEVEAIKMSLEGNYFAACCLAATLKFIEVELSQRFAPHSLRIKYEPSEGSMMIDLNTIISLELIQNLQIANSKDCLFGILNETLTPMGSRLLRSNVLQPSTEPAKLEARYDAVEELAAREDIFFSVRHALKGFVDADKVLSSLIVIPTKITFQHAEGLINNVIMLKTYISAIKPIYEALIGAKSSLLAAIRDLCAPSQYHQISERINATINEDVTYQTRPLDLRNQRTYAIKAGVSSLLDVARQTYKEANNDAIELSAKLAEAYDMPIDLRFETARSYYFRLLAADCQDRALPDAFINVYKKKKYLEFQTLDLVKLNQKITDAHNEVVNMSDRSIQELIDEIRGDLSGLFRISEGVAVLDMLSAFAQLATKQDYVRPELTDTLAIKAGRHPILEKIHASKYIPNDAYATQQSRFQIVTGCNMSGKSTYIRSLALITIMAQIGCFVPAQYASFPLAHQLFARVSADNSVEANVSTFSAEMREMSFILRNIRPRSIIIVDELGRGTSTVDGLAIAIAIAEALVESQALVWFTTHFRDLPRIMAERPGVVNLHLAVDIVPECSKMTMLYKIADGYVQDKHYGLQLAKLLPFPSRMLEIAQTVSEAISARNEANKRSNQVVAVSRRRKLMLELREQLMQARQGVVEPAILRGWLKRLQDEFTLRMTAISEGTQSGDEQPDEEDGLEDSHVSEEQEVDEEDERGGSESLEDEDMPDAESVSDLPSDELFCRP